MSGSIGKVIIPVVSTFDASGIAQAKSGLKELQQAAPGGGKSAAGAAPRSSYADEVDAVFERTRTANEKYEYQVRKLDDLHRRGAISSETYHRAQRQAAEILPRADGKLGLGDAARGAISQYGGPLSSLAGLGAGAGIAGGALAGIGVIAATMHDFSAISSELKRSSAAVGMSTLAFSKMSVSAQSAGLSVGELSQAVSEFRDAGYSARMGDRRGSALFASLGIDATGSTDQQISQAQAGLGKLTGSARTRAAVALYGERGLEIADANDKSKNASGYTARQTQTMNDFGNTLYGTKNSLLGRVVSGMNWLEDRINVHHGSLWYGEGENEKRAKALEDKQMQVEQQSIESHRQQEAKGLYETGRSAQQVYEEAIAKATALANQRAYMPTGSAEQNMGMAAGAMNNARAQRYAATSSYMTARERQEEEEAILRENPRLNPTQRERGILSTQQTLADQLAPVRSLGENLRAQIDLATQAFGGRAKTGEERQEIARGLGNQIGDYAAAVAHAGGLAGAADMNSVAGYGQVVGAEEAMRQSSDQLQMMKQIISHLDPSIQEQVLRNVGYQFGTIDFINGAGRR